MRRLTATTRIAPLALAFTAAPVLADTTIGTATTANVRTSTANNGAADNVIVSSTGSIAPTSGTAITIDSNNTVTNQGSITTTDLSNVIAIGGGGGFTSGITNSGSISITETYAATDTNSDGILDGAFAQGSNRFGIRLTGSAPFVGTLNSSGAITIKGNDSGGIVSDVAITGNVINTSTIAVTGDRGYGIKLANVTGTVALSGAVSVVGQGSVAVALTGDVTGAVVVHNTIASTGYSSTTAPTDTSTLLPSNLLQGGSALTIGGNVGGGVLIATTTTSTDTTLDADGDGIPDTSQSAGSVTSVSSSPALLVGSASRAVSIGLVSGRTFGLAVDGSVSAAGVYAGVDSTAMRIGGLGGTVSIAGGIGVAGTVAASANGGTATALVIGSGATVPTLSVTGAITANNATTAGGNARGVLIESGGSLASITNAGTISVGVGVGTGVGSAILDQSNTLASVTNTGTITATDAAGTARAIDVSASSLGFTYTQSQSTTATAAPALTGAIVTGSGNDTLTVSAGTVKSAANLGGGNNTVALSGTGAWTGSATFGSGNDSLTLAGTSTFTGTVDFGTGNDQLTVGSGTTFSGRVLDATGHTAFALNGGTANFTTTDTNRLGSLAVTGGTIGVAIDPATGNHTLITVAGATTVTGATTIKVAPTSFGLTAATYTVIQSGTMTGGSNFGLSTSALPYLLTGSVAASDTAGTVAVTIQRKSATQLGLLRSEAAAYDAVYTAIAGNSTLSNLFLGFSDRDSTIQRYRQMLPDHAGGVFDALSNGARLVAPAESAAPWADMGDLSLWMQQAQWASHQDGKDTPGYRETGWGMSLGSDIATGHLGRFGLSIGYVHGDIHNKGGDNEVTANLFQGGAYWIGGWGPLQAGANASFGGMFADSRRSITGTSTNTPQLLSNKSNWSGTMASAAANASYELRFGRFYLKPKALFSYARLDEGKHDETGGGTGYDLTIQSRKSDELALKGTVALGLKLGSTKNENLDAITGHIELEGGRREILGGSLGATTARFTGGNDFTLLPEGRASGYLGGLNAAVGSSTFRFVADVNAEQRDGYKTYVGRIGLRGAF